MKSEFMRAINQVCAERGLSKQVVLAAVEEALVHAYKRSFGTAQGIVAKVDLESGTAHVYVEKEVVATVTDPRSQISLEEARKLNPEAKEGDKILVENTPSNFGRIAAQTAKQVILQRIREAERDMLYNTYLEQEGELIVGTVQSIDHSTGTVILNLGRVEAILPPSEQIPTERYEVRQRLRVYVKEVQRGTRGPQIIVSRAHRRMLRRLFEMEVPEIYDGRVEVKAIAREAGFRSKVAVAALERGVDPVGACVGVRGTRIQNIVNELGGERIDIIEWSPDPRTFIASALSPAKVTAVFLEEGPNGRTATVVVPDRQLSLAIGREGQNARLAAKLTGWRIDIKSESEMREEAAAKAEEEAPTEEQEEAPVAEAPIEEATVTEEETPAAEGTPTGEEAPLPEEGLPEGTGQEMAPTEAATPEAEETPTEEEAEEDWEEQLAYMVEEEEPKPKKSPKRGLKGRKSGRRREWELDYELLEE